jgi:membrane-associated phospholipid phosphatase
VVAVALSSLRRNNACRILLASAGCFLVLALAVLLVDPFPGDASARLWVLGFGSPEVLQVARLINHLGSWQVLLPLTLGLFGAFPRARRRWWIWLGLMIAAPAAEGLLKILIGRARPEEASMGFPSGHATAAAAFFGAVIYLAASLPPRARTIV